MKLLLYITFLLQAASVWAQTGEKCFKAYNAKGQEAEVLCVGQEYEFQDCKGEVPDENEYYIFDYKNGAPITNASDNQLHTYTAPGTYRVLQVANYGSNTLTDTISVLFEVRDSPAPTFTTQTCANGSVTVTITGNNYSNYTLDFGDGKPATAAQPGKPVLYRYAKQGTYSITLSGFFTGGTCTGESKNEVTTLPAAPAPFIRTLTVLEQANGGQLQLELENLQPGFGYLVQRQDISSSGTSFLTVDTIRNVTQAIYSHRLANVNTTEGTTYIVKPYDTCGSAFQSSEAVSSIALDVTPAELQAILNWQSMPYAQRYEVYKNGKLLQTLGSTTSQYIDNAVICGQTYSFEVRGLAADGSHTVSAARAVQVISTATPAAPYLRTTYNLRNEIELLLELPQNQSAQQISLERSVSGEAYQALGQGLQSSYLDAVPAPGQFCYRATFTNACGNTSVSSNVSCPIYLQAEKQGDGAAVSLEWTKYEGSLNGVKQYTVELLDADGNVVSSFSPTGNAFTDRTLSDDLQQLRYRVKATAWVGTYTYSNTVAVEQDLILYIPSGFTPNGDGLNDVFEIKGRFFSSYSLRVYNKLGQVVYEGTAADAGWDGTYKGEPQPAGAYAYEVTAASDTGASRQRTGTITLLR